MKITIPLGLITVWSVNPWRVGTKSFQTDKSQHHGCWCPGSLFRQDISTHGTDYAKKVSFCLTWGRISDTCVMSMWRNDRNYGYFFLFSESLPMDDLPETSGSISAEGNLILAARSKVRPIIAPGAMDIRAFPGHQVSRRFFWVKKFS